MKALEFNSVLLSGEEANAIHNILFVSGHKELAELIFQKAQRSETDHAYAEALELWDDVEFEIDENPVVSASEEGAFVMVWQWVGNENMKNATISD
jgi:hypothetical protein